MNLDTEGGVARRRAWLLGIVAVAVVVRLAGLGDRLTDAEAYSWFVASAGDLGELRDRLLAYENTPPLFYVLLAFGPLTDEAWVRWPAFLAGVLAVPVLYAVVRPLAGARAALLSAGLLAIAPYHVSYSNYSRAFVLAGLAVLVAAWGAVRATGGGGTRWYVLYAAGAAAALWSELDAAFYLAPLALLMIAAAPRRRTAIAATAAALLLVVPWLTQLPTALDALDQTKIAPTFPEPGLATVRDVTTALAFGEHGALEGAAGWLQLALTLGVVTAAAVIVRRFGPPGARTLVHAAALIAGSVVTGTVIVSFIGPDLFNERYLTTLIPLAAAVIGTAAAVQPWRWVRVGAVVAIGATALAVIVQRHGRELEPDPSPLVQAVAAAAPAEVRTNTALVAWHLRELEGIRVILDRPFGLAQDLGGCDSPECVVVEDSRSPGGLRPEPVVASFGPYAVIARR